MKKLLFWLCLVFPFLSIAQETAPVTFRLDVNQITANTPNPDQMQVYIQTSVTGWTDIPMEDVGGNGIYRKNINIGHPTDENVEVFYRFKITSFGDNGLPWTGWEGGPDASDCLFDVATGGAPGGPDSLRKVTVPEELIANGTYVNPSGEYKLTHCVNVCGNAPCEEETTLVEFKLDMNEYPDEYNQPYVTGEFSNWTDQYPMEDEDGDGIWELGIELPEGTYLWKFMLDNWADSELPAGVTETSACFIPDGNGFINRILDVVIGDSISLPLVCWESCLPCGAVLGCTDPESQNYNPWATIDDGSCSVIPQCEEGQTLLQIIYTGDNWPGESSWILYGDNNGVDVTYASAPQGSYNSAPPGVPLSTYVCVDQNSTLDLVIEDSYGDGLAGTTSGGTVDGNIQVIACDGTILYDLSENFPNSNFGYLTTTPQFTPITCESESEVEGCMNPFSTTYNPLATVDDGSCGPPRIEGCTDQDAFNYNPDANTSEIMQGTYTLEIFDGASDGWNGTWLGLTQGNWVSPQYQIGANDGESISFEVQLNIYEPIEAFLFTTPNSNQTLAQIGYTLTGPLGDKIIDVGYWQAIPYPFVLEATTPTFGDTCIPIIEGCMDENSLNYIELTGDPLVDVNTDDGSCIPIIEGCMNPLAFNYNPDATVDDGSCVEVVVGCMDPDSFNYNPDANTEGDCIPVIEGCMDETSFNYNENANVDDGSCIAVVEGCMDENSINYNPDANTDDGSCIPIVEGCMDQDSFNYDPNANVDDGSCVPVVYGCMDPDSFNYNPDANTDNGTCEAVVFGCTDPDSFNYNPDANTDNGTCVPVILGCTDNTSFNYNPEANTNDGSCIPILAGCTNPDSFNYNELANTDDGSCIDVIYGCTDNTSLNYNPEANTDDGTCVPILYGCMDPNSFNYNALATVDDGSCIPIVTGCTDPDALNYNPDANTEDYTCIEKVYGCMDPDSVNYDPEANVDNGTCITAVVGCMDPESYNYNPEANVADPDACLYDAGCITGPGEPYWLNNQCYAWVIDVDNYCCENEWDPICQETYNYCENGWPEGMDIDGMFSRGLDNVSIIVYPNPTDGIINIATNLDITYSVRDLLGKIIIQSSDKKQLDLSNVESGVYFLSINHEGQIFNKRIIIE